MGHNFMMGQIRNSSFGWQKGIEGALNNVIHTIRKRTPEANRNGVEAALLLKGVVNSLSNADKPKVYQPAPDHPVAMS
ncbi:Hypothetical predicted protein [Podarcis lilfordi]|nr:Hypothetical predicted protein [Podarcis lilfordi]